MPDARRHPPAEHPACLGLGSNCDPAFHLPRALSALRRASWVAVEAVSTAWQSPAVGSDGPDYLNAALLVTTRLPAPELRSRLKRLENALGRTHGGEPSGPVTIDIDILTFDGSVLSPDLWTLAYRCVPAAELRPDLTSPLSGQTLAQAARRLALATRIEPRPDVFPGAPVAARSPA